LKSSNRNPPPSKRHAKLRRARSITLTHRRRENHFRNVLCNAHACGKAGRIDADEVDERRRRAFQADREIRFSVIGREFWTDAGVGPLEILVTNSRKKLLASFKEDPLRSGLGWRRGARAYVQPAVGPRAKMDAFRTRPRRHRGIHKRADAPSFDASLQLILVAANEFDFVAGTAGHPRQFMRGKPRGIDQSARFDGTLSRTYDVMR